ncbi:hypothetical protein FH972_026473 [Carpinus fangiana]|uniref:Fe2OG dioxygenase domain-containing protein n=1 Tax=Carpinus fangiana TaxID=176857 RepID=A0A5N6L6L7_9ROSI|nr:hypothetical protein FH972_026473 [Carpinus fangiana]
MGSLADLLSQSRPDVETRRALLVLDLQNDFVQGGKLPITYCAGLTNLGSLCEALRAQRSPVVWLRTEFSKLQHFDEANSAAGDDAVIIGSGKKKKVEDAEDGDSADDSDEEFLRNAMKTSPRAGLLKRVADRSKADRASAPKDLFLSSLHPIPMLQCCQTTTYGADFTPAVTELIDSAKDMVLVKGAYSAFNSTNLLFNLRSRMVTQLIICGSLTNVSVYATAASAVQHGMQVTILEDCLGYIDQHAHEDALKQMEEIMGATITTVSTILQPLQPQTLRSKRSSMLPRISVNDQERSPSSGGGRSESPAPTASPVSSSRPRTKLPQRSPSGTQTASTNRSDSRSSHNSPTSSRIPFVRSDSRSSVSSETPHVQRQTSNLALRQKPMGTTKTPTEWQEVILKRTASQQLGRDASAPITGEENQQGINVASPTEDAVEDEPLFGSRIDEANLKRPTDGISVSDGDSLLVNNALYDLLEPQTFSKMKSEVHWQKMFHATGEVPRLVCAQGIIDTKDGSMPVYRHPSDQALPLLHFSPQIDRIRRRVEERVGHPINHCLVQLYRSGQDFISEHSDKTLDIIRGSWIVNVSLGAQRTMRLRAKRQAEAEQSPRQTHKFELGHGSMFLLGPQDNAKYLHGIPANKRPASEKSALEQAYDGERISLTFRYIGTFLDARSSHIWGQGATSKTRRRAAHVVNGDEQETTKMVRAFGIENQSGREFDWEGVYGAGFDVLHFHATQDSTALDDSTPILFRTLQSDIAIPIEIFFAQHHMPLRVLPRPPSLMFSAATAPDICLRDGDAAKTQVSGLEVILLYLDRFYGAGTRSRVPDVGSHRLVLNLARMATLSTRRFLTEMEAILQRHECGAGESDSPEGQQAKYPRPPAAAAFGAVASLSPPIFRAPSPFLALLQASLPPSYPTNTSPTHTTATMGVTNIVNLAMRGLQFFWALLVLALTGNMIAEARSGNPSTVNYAIFCAVFALLSLFYLIPATISEGFAISPILLIALDVLNTLFWFCAAVALSAYLGVHSCGNEDYLRNNEITNGADNMSKRCHEAQASTAFLWFGFAAFAASAVLSGLSSRGGANLRSGGARRGVPSMSKV